MVREYVVLAEFDQFDIRNAAKVEKYLNDQWSQGLEFVGMCGNLFIFRKVSLVDQIKPTKKSKKNSP
jgi:hypothetical protein